MSKSSLIRWNPTSGNETKRLVECLKDFSAEGKTSLIEKAASVLGKCVPPTFPSGVDTGIAIGYVQSGKTLNFTTVAALARDNGFPLIIVITGTSKNLFHQSTKRVLKDLGVASVRGGRHWRHFPNPKIDDADAVRGVLENWKPDSTVPNNRRQAVLVTVMKHHRHLSNLNDLLQLLELVGTPALVIDDEADQAGLNNEVLQGRQSRTYESLLILKSRLPHHTFLQYTATPQAPLLINIIDSLSPSFAEILTPGPDYCGGREFFADGSLYVNTIPPDQIPTKKRPLSRVPSSLLDAMQRFFIGVAYATYLDEIDGNRSMLVHPSRQTDPHGNYKRWITRSKKRWATLLASTSADSKSQKEELIAQFETAYEDMALTVPTLKSMAPFEDLMSVMPEVLRTTEVIEVNAARGQTPEIVWENAFSHILVGGQSMDRGFTVEGLTVTYMPRHIGVGNADSIQQRARFFGYKRKYLGFCRIYLEDGARNAYEDYVEHEEDIRGRLMAHCDDERPLREWKRAFLLSSDLKPTRLNLIDVNYIHDTSGNDWFFPRGPVGAADAVTENRAIAKDFLDGLTLSPDAGHSDRTLSQKHLIADAVPLKEAFEKLLTRFRMMRMGDSLRYFATLMQIRAWLDDHPDETCRVYKMSPGQERIRTLNNKNEMRTLHQGPYSKGGVQVYLGDFYVKADEGITIQLFSATINNASDKTLDTDVPILAIWIPNALSEPFFIQDQGG